MLDVVDADVYAGYGDYTANTGPIHAESEATPGGVWADHFTVLTEQIGSYLQLADGRVMVPHIDPSGPSVGGYSERDLAGAWHDRSARFAAEHVFDMAQLGSRLFAAGSEGGDAVVWVSTDSGDTWTESLRTDTSDDFQRFYCLAVVGSTLFVRSPIERVTHQWTAGGGWSTAAFDLLPDDAQGGPCTPWGAGVLIPSNVRRGASPIWVYYFDGASSATPVLLNVAGYSVAGDDSLYYLEHTAVLRRIPAVGDPVSTIGIVGQIAGEANCSLLILGGQALVGTDQSRIKVVTLP